MIKKSLTVFGALLFSAFFLTSCNTSMENDAEKLAKMQCKAFKILEEIGKGEVDYNESAVFAAEVELLEKEMKEKYSSKVDKEKFEQACLKATVKACD